MNGLTITVADGAGGPVPYVKIGGITYRPSMPMREIDQLAADVLAYARQKGHLPPAGSSRLQLWKAVEEAGEFVQAAAKVQLQAALDVAGWQEDMMRASASHEAAEDAAVEEACDTILATLAWLALRSGYTPQQLLRDRLDAVIERGR